MDIDHVEDYPAVKWKQHNIQKMSPTKRSEQLQLLAEVLGVREKNTTQKKIIVHKKVQILKFEIIIFRERLTNCMTGINTKTQSKKDY